MRIVESILTENPCYKAGRKITVKGLMLHSVGCPQPNAEVFVKMWNNPGSGKACVHAFIDGNTGKIYQTLPWNHRAWHCGGNANNTHIGVEMCEPACIRYTNGASFTCSDREKAMVVVKHTYDAAVELFAMLCKKYNLNPLADGVIISHKEGSSREIASNHGDPEHLWRQLEMGYTMDGFRKAVASVMNSDVTNRVDGAEVQPEAKWMQGTDGRWWYRHADGSFVTEGWEQINGKWYYFDEKGWMQTGWLSWKGKWYYCNKDGVMVSNQILTLHDSTFGEEVYAFAADGHMLTQVSSRGTLA